MYVWIRLFKKHVTIKLALVKIIMKLTKQATQLSTATKCAAKACALLCLSIVLFQPHISHPVVTPITRDIPTVLWHRQ